MASATEAVAHTDPMLPRAWQVRSTVRETVDVVTLELVPGVGVDAAAWLPGQFNMLYVFGVGEVPISIAGGAAGHVLHTIREVGPVSRALGALAPGDCVGLRGPFGTPWPIAAAHGADIVVAAGGIGLAPLRPVIEQVCREREAYGAAVVLYGVRKPADQLFPDRYDAWRAQGIQFEMTVDHADQQWQGNVGVVTTLVRRARFDASRAEAFLCGPEVMMRFTAQELERAGVRPARTWVSMERNMQCALGFCGHCQLGPEFICMDGPVFAWPRMRELIAVREL